MRLRRHRVNMTMGSSLMLTPMLDVLTVVLIFLILNFSPEKSQIQLSENIQLPKAEAKLTTIPRIRLEITPTAIKVNGDAIEGLTARSTDRAQWEKLKAKLKEMGDDSHQEGILLVADGETPYDDIDRSVARLAALGFSDVYLLTQMEAQK